MDSHLRSLAPPSPSECVCSESEASLAVGKSPSSLFFFFFFPGWHPKIHNFSSLVEGG